MKPPKLFISEMNLEMEMKLRNELEMNSKREMEMNSKSPLNQIILKKSNKGDGIMTNRWIWFNIGQKGTHMVTWQCAVIKDNFDPNTILFEDCIWDKQDTPKVIWVPKEKLSYDLHKSLAMSFKDLDKVAEWVKQSYETRGDVYCGNKNWVHIYNVFELDNKNEYGVPIGDWD